MGHSGKYRRLTIKISFMEVRIMLVSAKEMLQKAKAGHYAVGQFNINNLEWTKAILATAQECNSPVILGVSEGAGKYMTGYKTVVGMVKGMMEEMNITVPVALHLDHGSFEGCLKCVEAGFSSIMFDGSHYPIEENVAKTKELVKICAEHGMSLEAEVGSIGGEEDGVIGMGECADPKAVSYTHLSVIQGFDIEAKIVLRKKYYVVYLKEGSGIVDILNVCEAPIALMKLENLRIVKEMRNSCLLYTSRCV